MNMLPEVGLVCESSWCSQGHTCLQAFLSCPAQLCLFYSCSFTQDPLSSFWKHSSYLSCIWKCVGAVSYLPCILRNYWGQVLGWLLRPQFVQELKKFSICLFRLSSVLWTAAVCYPLQASAPGPCIPCSCLSPSHSQHVPAGSRGVQ